jgi:nitrite reductase/ring-hydroxylating ferredoxin subunit
MKKWYEERHAPAPGAYLCDAGEVGAGEVREFRFGGDTNFPFRMFIYNDGGELKAYRNACPHYDVPLNHEQGKVFTPDGKHFLCMTHHAIFEPGTGLCVQGPCKGEALDTIPLRQDGDRLLVGTAD